MQALARLTMDVFWRKPNGAGIFPLPPQFIVSTGAAGGDLTTVVKMRSDIDYLVRVSARTEASTNCYAGLAINIVEIISIFPRPE